MRTILTTVALVVALAAPAQAQDLRSPDARDGSSLVGHDLRVPDRFIAGSTGDSPSADARIAGRAGWIDVERTMASGDGGGIDIPPAAIVLIPALALAALGLAVLERRRRLA